MKTNIKSISLAGIAFILSLVFTSCQKGEVGPKGDTGATGATGQSGPQAKTFNFSLTFNAGDTYKSYGGITGYTTDDVVLVFNEYEVLSGTSYWAQLPIIYSNFVNIIPQFSETDGFLFINTLKADGTTGSPWTSTNTFKFKAVLISSSQIKANPNVNLNNYLEVKKAFNLKD